MATNLWGKTNDKSGKKSSPNTRRKKATDFRSSRFLDFNYKFNRNKQQIFGEVLFSSLKIDRKIWSKFLVKFSLPPGSNL